MNIDPHDYRKLGFPPHTGFDGLLVSEPARMVVVSAHTLNDPKHCYRLFVRGFEEPHYKEIPWPDGANSWDTSLVASPTEPALFARAEHWKDHGVYAQSTLLGLFRIPLPAGPVECLVGPEKGTRISRLLAPGAKPHSLIVVRSEMQPIEGGHRNVYSVQSFDTRTLEFTRLAELPVIFA